MANLHKFTSAPSNGINLNWVPDRGSGNLDQANWPVSGNTLRVHLKFEKFKKSLFTLPIMSYQSVV